MIKVGIIGGAGYTGGEMIRLLINHPEVEISFVQSSSNAGNYVHKVHTDLLGDTDIIFSEDLSTDVDVIFLCAGHGVARSFLTNNDIPSSVKIIDLSQDFRLDTTRTFGDREFVYGLPEMNFDAISKASNIANPGCFATALQLAMLPLAAAGVLTDEINISAATGSTGAGQKLASTSHFSWRANNFSVYKCFEHQHLNEIGETLHSLMPKFDSQINFVPYRGDFTRGIFATVYTKCSLSEEEILKLYNDYYKDAAFTVVSAVNIALKQVVNTNKCLLYVAKCDDKVVIMSAIDNLLKGASGQAVQNMNIIFGLDQKLGLRLKPAGF